jgi:Secretion system C-terminal sorting domain
MKKSMFSSIAMMLLSGSFFLQAQTFTKGAIVVEGNDYGTPGNYVKMAKYESANKKYVYFDSIPGDFTNDVLTDGAIAYIHVGNADARLDKLYKYNVRCPQRLDSVSIAGFQKMKLHGDQLIVSRAFGADSNYVAIYDKNNFALLASFHEVTQPANGIAISGNKAYVAVNGSWPAYTDSGTIAVIDLSTNTFDRFIKLDTFAKVVNEVFVSGTKLYCVADFDKITEYDLSADTFAHYYNMGIDAPIGIISNLIYYSDYTGLASFNILTHAYASYFTRPFTQMKWDAANSEFYFLNQDWMAYTSTFSRTDGVGVTKDSFMQGVGSVMDLFIDSNTSPVVTNYTATLDRDNDTSIFMGTTDADCDRLSYTIVAGPSRIGAIATIDETGLFYYMPAVGLVARDTVVVRVNDLASIPMYATVYLSVTDPLAINEISLQNLVKVYPNPFAGKLLIQNTTNATISLSIRDISGQLVFAKNFSNGETGIDLAWLSAGIYTAQVKIGDQSFNQKIVKQ